MTIRLTWSIAASLALGLGAASLSVAAHAANSKTPYSNVHHSNDAGNNTGDAEVEKLNQQELDKIQQMSSQPAQSPMMMNGQNGMPAPTTKQ
jgi:hypothetical protein